MAKSSDAPREHLSSDGVIRPCSASSREECKADGSTPVPEWLAPWDREGWAEMITQSKYGEETMQSMKKATTKPYVDTKPTYVGDFNDSPINRYSASSYVFIDVESGSVIPADSAFIIEQPMFNNEDEHEEFLNNPNDFVAADAKYAYEVLDLKEFNDPLLVDLDSGLILHAGSVRAVDIDDDIDVDDLFEDLDYQSAVVDSIGFDHFRK